MLKKELILRNKREFVSQKHTYKLGLALSGGGARGFAHVGALYAMEELGIYPDIIAGVSAGSIAASMYGSGLNPLEIMKLFMKSRFTDFCELGVPKDGFFKMDGFRAFLKESTKITNLEECKIPTVICATDLDNCTPVQWRTGELATRVSASCSMPIVFKPVEIDGIKYVDGGVLHNLPAWAIREECEYLIGVNVSPLVHATPYKDTLIDIAQRSYHLMSRTNAEGDLKLCDVVVSADAIAHLKVFNMKEKEKAFRTGYKAAMKALRNSPVIDLLKTDSKI